ncbi:Wzz/FepE/Etk N-terminal domain-containing protein [Mesorhizobium sp. IMUNJ 23232]|uniref:Wzz/FepE/Etk N-terminal domain-containing protein n=1 Tax=Mesorhizobium sp. IMUNJ 23232 TaxID=3376064 RepID=UPI0037BB0CD0
MLQPDDNDALERERSLLSLGDALRDEPAPEPSRLARAIAEVRSEKDAGIQPSRDAAARHRLARSRRSVRETPLLNALRHAPEASVAESQPEPEPVPQPAKARENLVAAAMPDMVDEPDFPSTEEAAERRYEEPVRSRETRREEAATSMWEEPAPQRRPAYREPPAPSVEEVAERRYEELARSLETRREEAAASTWEEPAPRQRPAYREPPAPSDEEIKTAERRADGPEPPQPPRQEEPVGSMWDEPVPQSSPVYREPAYREPVAQAAAPGDTGGLWNPLIDPGTVVAGIIRSKWIIVATTIAGALLGVLIALNTPKKFEASTELLADPRDLNLVDRELTQSGISNEATLAIVENQVRILTSGTVISKVVNQLHLADDPEFNGQGPASGLKGMLSPILSVFRAKDGEDDPNRRYALAAMNLGRALSVERGGKTFVIVVSATANSADKSALIANTMADVFLQSYGQLQSDTAGRAATELSSKLDELRKGVEAAERKVETFRSENDLVDAQGRLISDDEILKLNEQLSIARARTLELNARAASTRSVSTDAVLAGSLPEELASPSMQELRAQYSALRGEADRLAVRLGPRHPQRLALESQLSGARGLIDAELRRIVSSIQTDLKRAVQLEQELSSRLAQLKARQASLSDKLVSLRELERDATAKRAVYEAYLLRARETGEQQGINSANISVISKAYPPLESEPPSRSQIALAGMLLGLMAGIGIGGVRGTMDSLRDRAGGKPPKLAWRLRRRPVATMFGQDNGMADADDAIAETAAEGPAENHAEQGSEPAPSASHSQFAYSSEPPKDTSMQHPFAMQPPPFDPNQPQPPAGYTYAAPGQAQQPMPQAAYPQQPAQPASYTPQQQPSYAPPQPVQPAAYAQQPVPPAGYPPQQPSNYAPQQPMPQAAYAQPYYPPYPQQQPQPIQQTQPGYAQPYGYAQPAPPQQHPYAQPAQGYWQPQPFPPAPQPYVQPMPAYPQGYAPQQQMPPQQPVNPQPQRPIAQSLQPTEETPIEEIRASLREFRDAIRDLAESRSRRRYF